MEVALRVVVGGLLVAHGLVHLLYFVTNADDPKWPFTLERSWLVPEPMRRGVAISMIAVTIAAFAVLALAVWGVPGLAAIWPALAIVAALASLAVLVAFWNGQLVFGVVIDLAILVVAFWTPAWAQRFVGY